MQNRLDLTIKSAVQKQLDEVFFIQVISNFTVNQIAEFIAFSYYRPQ